VTATEPGFVVEPHIRLATVADARRIAEIHIRAWQDAYRGLVPDAILDAFDIDVRTERWRETFEREAAADTPERTWIVEAEGEIAGFALAAPARDESAPPPEGAGEIAVLYMDSWWRGRGLGRALLARVADDLASRGFDPIVVWVFEANRGGCRFYEREGFRLDGARNVIDFDGTPIPEVRYRRP
jgi:L-amino acid N-acyltransferase YncA